MNKNGKTYITDYFGKVFASFLSINGLLQSDYFQKLLRKKTTVEQQIPFFKDKSKEDLIIHFCTKTNEYFVFGTNYSNSFDSYEEALQFILNILKQ